MGEADGRIGTRSQANRAVPLPEISPEEERVHRASADSRRNPVPDAEGGRREANSSLATFSRERRPFPGFQNRGEVYSCTFASPFDTVTWTGSQRSRPVHSHPARIVSSRSSPIPGRKKAAFSSRIPRGNSVRAVSAEISTPDFARAGRTRDRITLPGSV